MTQIMNTIASSGQTGEKYDFNKVDTLLDKANGYGEALKALDETLADDPDADTRTQQAAVNASVKELVVAAKDAGAHIPAMSNLTVDIAMDFMADLFPSGQVYNPDSSGTAQRAINNFTASLGMDAAEADALSGNFGLITKIFQSLFGDFVGLFQKYLPNMMDFGKGFMSNMGVITGSASAATYQANAVDAAPTVGKVDDTQFSQKVLDVASTGSIDMTNVFDKLRAAAPSDVHDEYNALEAAVASNDPKYDGLKETFGKMVTLDPEEFAKAANEGVNNMEDGQTPHAAHRDLGL